MPKQQLIVSNVPVSAGEDPATVYADHAPTPTSTLRTARAKIFAPDMSVQKLSALMGGNDRCRIVNWTYIARTDGSPRTLEFRQHAGTLDPVSIRHWLAFVVGMVRLAEFNGRRYAGEGYRWKRGSDEEEEEEGGLSVWELMEEGMEMGAEEVGWWREKERERERE